MGWGRCVTWAGLALTAFIALPGNASAAWSATAGFSETIEANDNPQVDSDSGGAVGSTTGLSLQAGYDWPTVSWTIGTDLGFSKFWGPGAQDSFDGVNIGALSTSLQKTTPLTNYNASFSGSFLPSSTTEIFDSGITNADTKTAGYSAQAGLTHQLNTLNSIGLSVSGASESFTDNGSQNSRTDSANSRSDRALTPNTYLTTDQSWSRTITPLTSLTIGATTSWYTAEDVTSADSASKGSTEQVAESVTAQIQTQLSERLSLTAGGGGNVVRTTGVEESTSTGFIGNVSFGYALPNASVSGFASHNLAPSSLGSLAESTQVGLSIGRQINSASSIFFSGAFGFQLPIIVTEVVGQNQQHQGLVLTADYQLNLTRNWNFSLGYSFTQQNNSDDEFFESLNNQGSSTSNAVFATISRSFDLLHSPQEESAFQEKADWMRAGPWPGRPKVWAAAQPPLAPGSVGGSRVTSAGGQY